MSQPTQSVYTLQPIDESSRFGHSNLEELEMEVGWSRL